MVNYCCVPGCLRNSGKNPNLTFFSLPKDTERQEKWLKAVGREDLLSPEMEKTRLIKRFCSRHFTQLQMTKRHMQFDAVPSLHLPGDKSSEEVESKQEVHSGIACNICGQQLVGFRYMCLSCPDYDLCQKCEGNEAHPEHLVVRLPKPVHFTKARKIARKCQRVFGSDPIAITNRSSDRSDDGSDDQSDDQSDDSEDLPITQYRSDDLELTVSERMAIQLEIERALKVPEPEEIPLKPVRRRKYMGSNQVPRNKMKFVSHVACQTDVLPDDVMTELDVALKEEISVIEGKTKGEVSSDGQSSVQCQTSRTQNKSAEVVLSVAKVEDAGSAPDVYEPRSKAVPVDSELDGAALAELSEFIIIPQRY